MPKITVEEQKEFSLLPVDSILHLKVDSLEIKNVQGRHGDWQKLEFKFKILGIQAVGDGSDPSGYEDLIAGPIWGSVPFRLTDSPENKLRQWAEAILGIDLGVGFELDTDLFLNRECRGITSQYDKRAKDSNGIPFKGHQVDSLLAKAGPSTMAPQSQQPQQWAQPQQQYAPPQQQQQPLDPWGPPQGAAAGAGWEEPPF